jgi:hypothetical protein
MGLDLSRIEAWTREMLEAEARRRRIRSPEFRTRSELVRLILKHQYGARFNAARESVAKGRKTVEQTRDLMAQVVSSTLSLIPSPLNALRRLRGELPERSQPAPPPAPRPEPRRPAPPAAAQPSSPGAIPAPPPPPAVKAPEPAPASEDAQPTIRTFIEEPIRTHSMARLLASQGLHARALAIYEELLAQNNQDEQLRREAQALRRGEPIEPPVLPDPRGALDASSLPDGGDQLQCDALGSGFDLRWRITEGGQRRARAVLGGAGELAVRVVAIRPDPHQVVRSEITERGPVAAADAWQTPPLPADARCFAAVGLRDGERFVAIVHARPDHEAPAHASPAHTSRAGFAAQ